jgi:hypothetical protein
MFNKEDHVAEIPIQQKRGGGIWPWIIGAIAVLLLLWLLFGRSSDNAPAPTGPDTTRTSSLPEWERFRGVPLATMTYRRI